MLSFLASRWANFQKGTDGLTSTEYAVLLGLIAVVLLAGGAALGLTANDLFTNVNGTSAP